jgi:hypothetical protein
VGDEKLLIHSGSVVKTLEISEGQKLDQIAIASVVLGQEYKVIVSGVVVDTAIASTPRCHVEFTAENRLDPNVISLYVEFQGAVHVAVIGYGHGRHAELYGSLKYILKAYSAVEQRVFTVNMKMDELF